MSLRYEVNTLIDDEVYDSDDYKVEKLLNKIFSKNRCVLIEPDNVSSSLFGGRVCYHYAFKNDDLDEDKAISYIEKNYNPIYIEEAKKGDIITYFDRYGDYSHYAKIEETDGTLKKTIIRSKWGTMGVFETDLYTVPKMYGKEIMIWRKKEKKI